MPFALLLFLLFDILSVVLAGLDVYLFYEWYMHRHAAGNVYALQYLYWGCGILGFMLLGRYPLLLLLHTWRKGEKKPNLWRTKKRDTLRRPDGTRIKVYYYGPEDAQPILFVHGWGADHREWFYQRKFFENDYRLIFIDLPGVGRSSRPQNKDLSLTRMAHDLDAVIKHAGAHKAIIWGHGFGGMIIQTYCGLFMSAHQIEVKAIVLQHTTYVNPVRTSAWGKLLTKLRRPVLTPLCYLSIILSPFIRVMRWLSFLNGTHHLALRIVAFSGRQTWRQLNFATFMSAKTPPSVYARGMLAMFRWGVEDWLYRIKVPALVISGSRDKLTKPEASNHISENVANAKLFTIRTGHIGQVEGHEEVNQAALEFIMQQG